jgi:hypothetical protein
MPLARRHSRPLDALVGHLGEQRGRLCVCLQFATAPPLVPPSTHDTQRVDSSGCWTVIPHLTHTSTERVRRNRQEQMSSRPQRPARVLGRTLNRGLVGVLGVPA